MLALNYMNVVSFDIMDDILIKTKQFFDMHNLDIKLFKADLLHMPFCDDSFDVALDSFIYHDLKADARIPYIKEVYRVLRPGGKFIFFSFSDSMEKKN
ncbi:MAG: class I SAM-dependent methyltransferase [bacterium]